MKRKHAWLPCGVGDDFGDWSREEVDILMKETDWQKWITDSMWRDLMDKETDNSPNLSKLRRRLAEWQVAIWRINSLNREMYESMFEEAKRLWRKFWAVQAYGREGLEKDVPIKESKDAILLRAVPKKD
ncbi:MAG: hypothetical protein V3W28_06115 [Thermoplasmata archaeon]